MNEQKKTLLYNMFKIPRYYIPFIEFCNKNKIDINVLLFDHVTIDYDTGVFNFNKVLGILHNVKIKCNNCKHYHENGKECHKRRIYDQCNKKWIIEVQKCKDENKNGYCIFYEEK